MKAWRRTSSLGPQSIAVDCGEQPGEQSAEDEGGGAYIVRWDWPFGASALIIEEEDTAAPGVWVLVVNGVNAADDFYEATSSFPVGTTIRARLRRVGSDVSCAVVTDAIVLNV